MALAYKVSDFPYTAECHEICRPWRSAHGVYAIEPRSNLPNAPEGAVHGESPLMNVVRCTVKTLIRLPEASFVKRNEDAVVHGAAPVPALESVPISVKPLNCSRRAPRMLPFIGDLP